MHHTPSAGTSLRLLHPFYVLRIAGEPAVKLAATWTGQADQAWRRLVEMRTQAASRAGDLCDRLAQLISRIDDMAERRQVLDLKRALHNGRPARPAGLAALRSCACADADLCEQIAALDALHVAHAAGQQAFAAVFDGEMAAGAQSMRALLESPNLQLALSYNNHTLLKRLQRHYRGGAAHADAKTTRNLEDSLLQFFCRASTKTSPLSSLTLMRVGQWQDDGAAVSRLPNRVERRIEAKAALMRHILQSWLRDFRVASQAFPLAINRSVTETDGKLSLQLVAAGKDFIGRIWGTGIDLASFDANPMLACVRRALADAPERALRLAPLVERMCALAPKLPRQAVESYLAKLYEIGYLVADTRLIEQTDLLAWAQRTAAALDPAVAGEFHAAATQLRALLEVMRGDDVEARIAASEQVDPAVFALASAAGAHIGGYLYRTPYYENCYYTGQAQALSPALIDAHRAEFDLIAQINRIMDANHLVHTSLCDYFISRYGEQGVCSDIHRFMEQFDAAYAPLVSEGKLDAEGVAPHSARTLALLRAKRAFEDYLKRLLEQGRDTALDPQALRGIVAMLPQGMRSRNVSYSYLVQPFSQDGVDGLVLNQVYGGRSGILSRFCEVLGDGQMALLRDYLRQGAAAGGNVELGGVFGFNANRHPPMADTELDIAPFGPAYRDTGKLSLADLTLVYIAHEHRLEFRDRAGRPIDIWYHGLLTPVMLPAVQRTIALAFSEGPCFLAARAMAVAAAHPATAGTVLYSPRLSLGRVVVSRRSWTVPYASCPNPALPAPQFYLAIREWQAQHALPERFFVRALLGGSVERARISQYAAMKEINFKDLKPFYVDLRNPRFVRLLQNMLKRHTLSLMVSELLPDFDQHATTVDDEAHVAELHFELTGNDALPDGPDMHWYALRIAYFGERGPLLLGPVAEALALARADQGVERAFFVPHWKFGPHVDLVLRCDAEAYALRVLPAMQAIVESWIAAHPSSAQIDPAQYEQTSKWIGTFEIDSGPYLPLLKDNTVAPVPYLRPKTLLIPDVADSKEQMLSDCGGLILDLYRLKDVDREAFFLTLHAMFVVTANTPAPGVREGYMSMRSHADYFFAAYDSDQALLQRFDKVDLKNRARLDQATRAAAAADYEGTGLPAAFVAILREWAQVQAAVDARSHRIVERHYDALVGQNDQFMEMATRMREDVPDAYFDRYAKRQMSAIGEAFINTSAGKAALQRPEFLAYRLNVNFFYSLLPLLEVAPLQKFLLCHLLSNSVERVFAQDWRTKVARIYAREQAQGQEQEEAVK